MISDPTHSARFGLHRNQIVFHFMGNLFKFPMLYLIWFWYFALAKVTLKLILSLERERRDWVCLPCVHTPGQACGSHLPLDSLCSPDPWHRTDMADKSALMACGICPSGNWQVTGNIWVEALMSYKTSSSHWAKLLIYRKNHQDNSSYNTQK